MKIQNNSIYITAEAEIEKEMAKDDTHSFEIIFHFDMKLYSGFK